MPTEVLLWTTMGIAALALAGVAVLLGALLLYGRARDEVSPSASATDAVFVGPLESLSFADSLDPGKFCDAARRAADQFLQSALTRHLADGVSIAVNSTAQFRSSGQMIVTLSHNGQKLLQSGAAKISTHSATGRALPVLIDGKTGRVLEIFKGAKGAKAVSQLANLSAIVTGVAHFIAGADIAKKLDDVGNKVDLLLAYRHIDQVAKLERIFTSAQEVVTLMPEPSRRLELWRLRGELRELRSAWRREVEHHLRQIEDPESASWIRRKFSRQRTWNKAIQKKILPIEVEIRMMEYALRLDQVLAVASGSVPEFEKTLAHEIYELGEVARLLDDKAAYIKGRSEEYSVDPVLPTLRAIIEHYAMPLSATLDKPSTAQSLAAPS